MSRRSPRRSTSCTSTELESRYLDELSGGQRQRAYVAMVLAQDTEYVLLDEPLNNLDMRHSVQMMGRLRDAARELGRTIVVVLHDINFAAHYADHIVAMKNGGVVEAGAPRRDHGRRDPQPCVRHPGAGHRRARRDRSPFTSEPRGDKRRRA